MSEPERDESSESDEEEEERAGRLDGLLVPVLEHQRHQHDDHEHGERVEHVGSDAQSGAQRQRDVACSMEAHGSAQKEQATGEKRSANGVRGGAATLDEEGAAVDFLVRQQHGQQEAVRVGRWIGDLDPTKGRMRRSDESAERTE